jgi:ABC-type lipopolysaccharide export system ATPase subunit
MNQSVAMTSFSKVQSSSDHQVVITDHQVRTVYEVIMSNVVIFRSAVCIRSDLDVVFNDSAFAMTSLSEVVIIDYGVIIDNYQRE